MSHHHQGPPPWGEQVIELEGTFDLAATWQVLEEIAKTAPEISLTLDFTAVQELHDSALAGLLALVSLTRRDIHCRGLARPSFKMLRHVRQDARRALWHFDVELDSTTQVAA